MWKIKTFQTKEQMNKFIYAHKIAYNQIYLNNVPYAIEYKSLIKIY